MALFPETGYLFLDTETSSFASATFLSAVVFLFPQLGNFLDGVRFFRVRKIAFSGQMRHFRVAPGGAGLNSEEINSATWVAKNPNGSGQSASVGIIVSDLARISSRHPGNLEGIARIDGILRGL